MPHGDNNSRDSTKGGSPGDPGRERARPAGRSLNDRLREVAERFDEWMDELLPGPTPIPVPVPVPVNPSSRRRR